MLTAENNECHVYLYDGSFEGLLTAVFEAWGDKNFKDICAHANLRPGFLDSNIYVETDDAKAERISRWIRTKVSESVGNSIYAVSYTHLDVYKRQVLGGMGYPFHLF